MRTECSALGKFDTILLTRTLGRLILWTVLTIGGCALWSARSFGQTEGQAAGKTETKPEPGKAGSSVQPSGPATTAEPQGKSAKTSSYVVAPLPTSSPAVGTGLVPVLGYIFRLNKKDKISPPSAIGAVGFFTNNGSRGLAFGAQLFFKEDRYRLMTAWARGNVNYDIYGSGRTEAIGLPLKQKGQIFFAEFQRRLGWKFFLGPRFTQGNSVLSLRQGEDSDVTISPDIGLKTNLTAVGLRLSRDTSPNRFYPTRGSYINFTSDFFSEGLGSKYSFQRYRATYTKYWELNKDQVLAYNGHFCATGGQPPFYANCIYGTNNQLRGYTAGKYFTRYLVATQLEFRQVLPKGFGAVAFGGLGEAIPGGTQLYGSRKFLPAGGAGLRYQLSRKYHVNLRADYSVGRDDHAFILGIGEAF